MQVAHETRFARAQRGPRTGNQNYTWQYVVSQSPYVAMEGKRDRNRERWLECAWTEGPVLLECWREALVFGTLRKLFVVTNQRFNV